MARRRFSCFPMVLVMVATTQVSGATPVTKTLQQVQAAAGLETLMWSLHLATRQEPPMKLLPTFRSIDTQNVPAVYVDPSTRLLETESKDLTLIPSAGVPMLHTISIDGKAAIVLTGLATDRVYNTLRLSSRQRASNVFARYVLPFVKEAAEQLHATPAAYYGIAIAFASADASRDNDSPSGENLLALIPRDAARKFAAGEITDADLAAASLIYLQDRDSKDHSRVRLALE